MCWKKNFYFKWIISSACGLTLGLLNLSEGSAFPGRRPATEPVWVGERHELTVSYLGIPGLYVTFEVLPHELLNERKVYHLRATANASALVNIFYRIDNSMDSWLDYDGLFSHQFHLSQNQSNLFRDSWERHRVLQGESEFHNRVKKGNDPEIVVKENLPTPQFAQDGFSAFYYLRTLPFKKGATFTVPVISDARPMNVLVTVLETDTLEFEDKDYPAWVIKLEKIDPKTGQPSKTYNRVWLTDDSRRILMKMDITTRFGHATAKLKKYLPGSEP